MKTIDHLWVKYSNGQFGLSVQKQIYVECGANLDGEYPGAEIWRQFGDQVGWRVKGDWIGYSKVIFNTSAPFGHFPRGGVFGFFVLGWYGFLSSHIETCKV
ncbi:MAG: GUN4 domain-containing protein [Leptolyngbya sp. SIO1E4]|nr:GUN4 domain-containing protein [Leptolyngbya sp. SIO1E4]